MSESWLLSSEESSGACQNHGCSYLEGVEVLVRVMVAPI